MALSARRHSAHGSLWWQGFSGCVGTREDESPRSHLAERRRRGKLAHRDPGVCERKTLGARGGAGPPQRLGHAFLRYGRRLARLWIRRQSKRKGRLLRQPGPRRFVGAGDERYAVDFDGVGGGALNLT